MVTEFFQEGLTKCLIGTRGLLGEGWDASRINVLIDLFRSHDLSGWAKAGWLVVLVILPFLGVLIYLIARGGGMQQRAIKQQQHDVEQLKKMVGSSDGPADQIAQAKALLDSGAINQAEFEKLKAKALG